MADPLVSGERDDWGIWSAPAAGKALTSRRLAFITPSAGGHQPMESSSRRFIAAYNGELYNFQELRRDLERMGHAFRGHSDTEVLLTAVDQWGVEEALRRFNGLFAFALWGRWRPRLHL